MKQESGFDHQTQRIPNAIFYLFRLTGKQCKTRRLRYHPLITRRKKTAVVIEATKMSTLNYFGANR